MNRASPGREYGARVAAEVERRYADVHTSGRRRSVPKLKRHPLGMAYVSFRVKGQRRYCYFGPVGSRAARVKYRAWARRWPAQLADAPTTGTWPGPRLLTHDGRTMRLSAWAAEMGLKATTLRWRLERGWLVARA